jgi:hypothetical protein
LVSTRRYIVDRRSTYQGTYPHDCALNTPLLTSHHKKFVIFLVCPIIIPKFVFLLTLCFNLSGFIDSLHGAGGALSILFFLSCLLSIHFYSPPLHFSRSYSRTKNTVRVFFLLLGLGLGYICLGMAIKEISISHGGAFGRCFLAEFIRYIEHD